MTSYYILALLLLSPIGFYLLYPSNRSRLRNIIQPNNRETQVEKNESSPININYRRELQVDPATDKDELLYRAGFLRDDQRRNFKIIKIIAPIVLGISCASILYFSSNLSIYLGLTLGALLGFYLPKLYLSRVIAIRDEEIMYYLPLVIEQLIVGVGSGLDVGPCIHRAVSVADERDTHNPVTELLRNVQLLTRSGTPLDEALEEVGTLSSHTELKHAFLTLGQVSKHGGEITKQLQELANAVSSQREIKIEARIKKLELHATGPVALVFLSFMSTLFVGIGFQLMKALMT